jgi:hypothetical protein
MLDFAQTKNLFLQLSYSVFDFGPNFLKPDQFFSCANPTPPGPLGFSRNFSFLLNFCTGPSAHLAHLATWSTQPSCPASPSSHLPAPPLLAVPPHPTAPSRHPSSCTMENRSPDTALSSPLQETVPRCRFLSSLHNRRS